MQRTDTVQVATVGNGLKKVRPGKAGFVEYVLVAFQSLRANKLRSFLTLLGIIIGIASIIAVISIIEGLDRYWKEKVSNFSPNTFVITQYPITTDPDEFAEMLRHNTEVHSEDAEAIKQHCTACESIGVETHKQVRVRFHGQTIEQVDLSGITPSIIEIEPYDIETGRNLLEWESDHSQYVAFIGFDVVDKVFTGIDPIDKSLNIDGHEYRIVGIAQKRGTVFGMSRDNFVKIPLSTYQKIYGSRRTVNITVKAKIGMMEEAEDQCRLVMRARRHAGYKDKDNFGIITAEGINNLFDNLTNILFSVTLFIVGISLLVGGIVIMNIMLVSVLERTKEIGIRKAVGASQRDVVLQFLIESVVLCCTGGLIGVAIAYGISSLISALTPLPTAFPLWAPLLAFGLSSLIGLFFGIYPAQRAGRLDPIVALRTE